MPDHQITSGETPQQPRFGRLRDSPPAEAVALLTGAATGSSWTTTRVGDDGGYPNGGIWRVGADRHAASGPTATVVKRTGPAHLGTSGVWAHRAEPSDPQWWGREAEFYLSRLTSTGWTDDVRAARCHVDDHGGCRDLWLEDVHGIPAGLDECRRAVIGLALWQTAHREAAERWLSTGWIATHVARQALDNARTQNHPAWASLIERGLDPVLRDWVDGRTTDGSEVERAVAGLPHALTHHDFHEHNIGTVDHAVVLIDWAYVGWGPIGHDAGHLAISLATSGQVALATAWDTLETAYCDALSIAGWVGDLAEVRRSMRVSNQLRMSWSIDYLLEQAHLASDSMIAAASQSLTFLYGLE